MDKGEFRNFLNHGVAKVHTLKQSTAVTRVPSNSYKVLWEGKCVDSRELRQPGASSLVLACSVDPRGDGTSLKVTSAR